MPIFDLGDGIISKLAEASFETLGFKERYDLQQLFVRQIDVLLADTLVLTEEFGDWEDSRRRIDILCLDRDGRLVVVELKRTDDRGHMDLQAIRYAAMISTLTFEKVVELHSRFLEKIHSQENAESKILEFLQWDEPLKDRFAQDVRIVLVAANFSREITTAVIWLNKRDMDIRCIRIKPHLYHDKVIIDVQQVIPLPEAADYQVQIRAKEREVREQNVPERYPLRRLFFEGLLQKAKLRTSLHAHIAPPSGAYSTVAAGSGLGGVTYQYGINEDSSYVQVTIATSTVETSLKIFDRLSILSKEIGANLDRNSTGIDR